MCNDQVLPGLASNCYKSTYGLSIGHPTIGFSSLELLRSNGCVRKTLRMPIKGITVWQALRGHQSTPQVMTMKVTLWQALRGQRSVPSSPNYVEHLMASTERPI
ncbi:hypothetical protein E3N88_04401 [Mikania micrantha]|uniref:Uncharacterized protein n=1 Tax=Mikania micrantha TaxID=192012 RepID=A0A5N6PVC6_9ASTR|nr:hypothetical protein E3N88_04401 [Mikania micrantha]